MANKIKYGLKNVHYAPITTTGETITYGTPIKIPGAVNLSISPIGDKTPFYADDGTYYTAIANNGYEGTLEGALVPEQFKLDILGYIKDDNGAMIEDSAATTKDFALLFEFSGDVSAVRHVLYNCNAQRANVEGSTKGQSIEAKTETLNITASPALDTGYVKAHLEPVATGYDDFYDSVYISTVSSEGA